MDGNYSAQRRSSQRGDCNTIFYSNGKTERIAVNWNLGRVLEKHPNQIMKPTHNLYFANKSYALENVIRLEGYSPSPLNAWGISSGGLVREMRVT